MQSRRVRAEHDAVAGAESRLALRAHRDEADILHVDIEEGVAAEMLGDADRAAPAVTLAPGESAILNFPAGNVANYRSIVEDTLGLVMAGDNAGAQTRVTGLETAWDEDQPTLQPLDDTGWTVLDGQIDTVLKSVRASAPDPAAEKSALSTLLNTLSS